ncbi:conserved hypothetical protein [Candidatus Desulfarcum epimagneticum]|uniref:Peptidase M16 n=1 Tax=uncultured Desulfobacteraceae bacterium TaxID=218296 RepID=A0A484HLK0_9BACT|nr:conserved hypothetical protein [uncultured Desulfobacteraceae bacterium]
MTMNEFLSRKTTLENGIRILTQTIPHARSVSMGVWVNTGARDEGEDENGLSHFIEHMIFKGTLKRTAFQIAKEFDSIGGHTNAFTSMENTCYYAKVISPRLGTMVEILSDIFLNSVFDEAEVEKERAVIFQEIGMTEDNPEEYVHLLSSRTRWGDSPLGRSILGSRENVAGFKSGSIKTFFRKSYCPERIIVSAAGDLDHETFVDMAGRFFKSIAPTRPPASSGRVPPESAAKVVFKNRDLDQVHVCLGADGLSITDPKRHAFSLLNVILGGNMSSRLFQKAREQKGLAYSIYSFVSSYVDTGMMGVSTAVSPDKALEVAALILSELEAIAEKGVEESEREDAAEYAKGALLLSSESVDNQMVRMAQNEIHFDRHISLDETIQKIDSVSGEDIAGLARRLFAFDGISATLLGPVGNIQKKDFETLLRR